MADTKLSALTELATTPADADEVYIRDVSEAAAAESKRITVTNLIGAAGKNYIGTAFTAVLAYGAGHATTTWTDLDLSASTPGAVAVHLRLRRDGTATLVGVRKNGTALDRKEDYPLDVDHFDVICDCDAAQIIEWYSSSEYIGITLLGYWA